MYSGHPVFTESLASCDLVVDSPWWPGGLLFCGIYTCCCFDISDIFPFASVFCSCSIFFFALCFAVLRCAQASILAANM